MLSIEVCKKHLGKIGKTMNETEIEEVRDFLYSLAHVFLEHLKQEKGEENA